MFSGGGKAPKTKERMEMGKILEKIAQDRMGISLEQRGSDSEDFHDISVWALKEMLEKAYIAGQGMPK